MGETAERAAESVSEIVRFRGVEVREEAGEGFGDEEAVVVEDDVPVFGW